MLARVARLVAGSCLALAVGCSLVVDTNKTQCSTTADCLARGPAFAGTTCTANGVCTSAPTTCDKNADCAARLGVPAICKRTGGATTGSCVGLVSDDCKQVVGNYQDDGVILLGSMFSTEGANANAGLAQQDAVQLAAGELSAAQLSIGGRTRPFAVVQCTETRDALRAATHLVDTVGVSAIIGGSDDTIVADIATNKTIPGGVLLMSPLLRSTTVADRKDLLWQVAPSDDFQGRAVTGVQPAIDARARTVFNLGTNDVKVALLWKTDTRGKALHDAIVNALQINGRPASAQSETNFFDRSYDDPSVNPGFNFNVLISTMAGRRPNYIIVAGDDVAMTSFIRPYEVVVNDPNSTYVKPLYLFADTMPLESVIATVGLVNGDLVQRVFGLRPASDSATNMGFVQRYGMASFTAGTFADVFGAAGAYDATYLIGLSAFANDMGTPTGANLALGLRKLVPPGPSIAVGPDGLAAATNALRTGASIDLDGASGPLDFNVTTGQAPSELRMWCLIFDGPGVVARAIDSGVGVDAAGRAALPASWTTNCRLQ